MRPITQGICAPCSRGLVAQGGMPLVEYLDRLETPVVIVNEKRRIAGANLPARRMLGKNLEDIVGFTGGEVFECAYSRLPGGCGRTEHCSGCTIRRAVEDTFATGEGREFAGAELRQGAGEGRRDLRLAISTELLDAVVLLRVDEVAVHSTGEEEAREGSR